MNMEIQITPELSLEEIKAAQVSGQSVVRSAHVGNLRGYNLAIAQMGIPFLLVDHNVVIQRPEDRTDFTAGDASYLSGSIVTGEKITPLTVDGPLGRISLKTEVVSPFSEEIVFVDQLHKQAINLAFEQTSVTTNTQFIRESESISNEVINILLSTNPELFQRYVEADGTIRRITGDPVQTVQRLGILQLNDNPRTESGVLIPNSVDIVLNFILDALKSDTPIQLHLSGPDMVQYLKSTEKRQEICSLYEKVLSSASFKNALCSPILVKLVPSAEARFVTSLKNQGQIETIFDLLSKEKRKVTDQKAAFFKSPTAKDPDQRRKFESSMKVLQGAIRQELAAAVSNAQDLFIDSKSAPFISQYDVLEQGGLAMPEENRTYSMQALKSLTKKLLQLRGDTS